MTLTPMGVTTQYLGVFCSPAPSCLFILNCLCLLQLKKTGQGEKKHIKMTLKGHFRANIYLAPHAGVPFMVLHMLSAVFESDS